MGKWRWKRGRLLLINPVPYHYNDVMMGTVASQITSLTSVYSTVYSDADQRKHQSSASLAFVQGIHRGPVNSPHKWRVTRKMFPFDDVIMSHHRTCLALTQVVFFLLDNFDVFFDLRQEQTIRHWRLETPLRSLWRHCNVNIASRCCKECEK